MPNSHLHPVLSTARAFTLRLRKVRGGVFIGEAFRRFCGKAPQRVRVTDFDGSLTLDLDLSEHMQSQIFWFGYYSGEIAEILKKSLRPGDTFVDCGANIGELTLIASKLVGNRGRVIAFEPLGPIADQLELHVALNDARNVELYRTGVSRESGSAPIFTAGGVFTDGTVHRGLGTLYSTPSRAVEAATVELVSLDDFVREHDVTDLRLIKLDVEGAELPALQGAAHVLERFKPLLIVEIGRETCLSAGYEPRQILSYISTFGYRIYRIGRRGSLAPLGIDDLGDFQNIFCEPNRAAA